MIFHGQCASCLAGILTDATPFAFNLHFYEPESKQEIEAATLNLVLQDHPASKVLTGPHSVRPMSVNVTRRSWLLVVQHLVNAATDGRTEMTTESAAQGQKKL